MAKFASLDEFGNEVAHSYGNLYFRQPCGNSERAVIGPSNAHIKLLDELAATFPTQRYYILYVLLLSHAGRSPGRYESPMIASHEDLQLFLWTFQLFFEGDGRHHLWIASADSGDLLVYDQHEVIFAYGDLNTFERVLQKKGFTAKEFWFPLPHSHAFEPANTTVEDQLMNYFEWKYFELQPDDVWT